MIATRRIVRALFCPAAENWLQTFWKMGKENLIFSKPDRGEKEKKKVKGSAEELIVRMTRRSRSLLGG